MTPPVIRLAETAADLDAVRALCRLYREALVEATPDRPEITQDYYAEDCYEDLLAELPQKHAAPDGAIYLGEIEGVPEGCGMIHRIDAETCEIKRVYVTEAARGTGLGRAIVQHAMADAKARGYARMVLDTMRPLVPAATLYRKLGFAPCPPFYAVEPRFADYILFFSRAL